MKTIWTRKIIHIDMDAFFAAIEQRDEPSYRDRPLVVGGDPTGRGVVSTASYEARQFGIHSAMPAAHALRKCPDAVFVRPNMDKYRRDSTRIMAILRQHTDLVEQVSLDEAYLDVTDYRFGDTDPRMIADMIKQNIYAVTQLRASAGVAENMFLAKVASDFQKPDGLTVIAPGSACDFLAELPVRKIPGVGPVTEARLHALGIQTIGKLAECRPTWLQDHFGKAGLFLHHRAWGRDEREVEPDTEARQASTEETFTSDVISIRWLREKLSVFARELFIHLEEQGKMGRTVVLKVKYYDFQQITRSHTLSQNPSTWRDVERVAHELLTRRTDAGSKPVRLLGLGISGLSPLAASRSQPRQKDLFLLDT